MGGVLPTNSIFLDYVDEAMDDRHYWIFKWKSHKERPTHRIRAFAMPLEISPTTF